MPKPTSHKGAGAVFGGAAQRAKGPGDHRTVASSAARHRTEQETRLTVPPITELTRIEPVHLERLEAQGVFTTGLLLEVSETPTRRQYLSDQVDATPNDVMAWRDEALMLNLAGFREDEHQLMLQAGIEGLRDILALDLPEFRARLAAAARELNVATPPDLVVEGWWEQARTLEEE
jgi:hypothetical protein